MVLVHRTRADADALWDEVAAVLAPMGLRLSEAKTRICHIDEGFDFLGWRIQRRPWRSRTGKRAVYTYPSKKSLASIIHRVRTLTRRARHRTLADLLRQLNPVLRGWCTYFQDGVSSRTFGYLGHYAFWRVVGTRLPPLGRAGSAHTRLPSCLGAGLNYLPLSLYPISLPRRGRPGGRTGRVALDRELRRYSGLQVWLIVPLAVVLGVSRSGYYDWDTPSSRAILDTPKLAFSVAISWYASTGSAGSAAR